MLVCAPYHPISIYVGMQTPDCSGRPPDWVSKVVRGWGLGGLAGRAWIAQRHKQPTPYSVPMYPSAAESCWVPFLVLRRAYVQ